MAERIQRKRSKGWKSPPNTVYVGRPTMWGNPFSVRESLYKDHWSVVFEGKSISAEFATKPDAQAEAVRLFEKWFSTEIADVGTELHNFRNKYGWKGFSLACAVNMLRGKNLSCWCGADEPCHAEVILRLANTAPNKGQKESAGSTTSKTKMTVGKGRSIATHSINML